MTNHGCSVCRSLLAVSTRNGNNAYAVQILRGNQWTENGVICTCGALNPFDDASVYAGTISNPTDEADPIIRDRAVRAAMKHGK